MELMNDEQLRRFMYNLCKYHEEKDVELTSDFEKAIWFGIEPALKTNNKKYEAKAEKSRENGKLGGAPLGNQNARKEDAVQNNLKQPKQPDNREEISEKGKEINDNSEMIKDNWQEINVNDEVINITGKNQIEISETIVLDQEILTSVDDNSNNSETSYSTYDDLVNPEICSSDLTGVSTSYFRALLNEYFSYYKEWEVDLYKLGFDDFIKGPKGAEFDCKEIRMLLKRFLEI